MTDDIKPPRKPRARPTELGAAKPLTDLQARFVEEYLVDMNAAGAARRAGYGPNTKAAYCAVLQRPHVRAAVDAAIAERVARTRVRADQVLGELGKVAFANMADYLSVGADGRAVVDLARLDRETGAAVQKVCVEYFAPEGAGAPRRPAGQAAAPPSGGRSSEAAEDPDSQGLAAGAVRRVTVTLADKRGALKDLARHLGLYREEPEAGGGGVTPIYVVTGVPRSEEFGRWGSGAGALPDLGEQGGHNMPPLAGEMSRRASERHRGCEG